MWPVFGPLWRTLSGGRAARSPASALLLGAEWAAPFVRFGLTADELRGLLKSDSLEPHFTYSRYRRPKPSGGWREIAEPDPRLKRIQRRIIREFLAGEHAHPAALAYQTGKSAADHARAHAGAAVVVTADVKDFFPTTREFRVEEWWRERVGPDAARLFALFTTDRGGLPQGAPTSPALSNLLNFDLDTQLAGRATTAGARYTRYCDDLAFSWRVAKTLPADFERGVRATLHEFGYTLHLEKGWRIHESADEPEITGVVLTHSGGVQLPERVSQIMKRLARSTDPRDAERLDGYRGYEEMVTGRRRKRRAT